SEASAPGVSGATGSAGSSAVATHAATAAFKRSLSGSAAPAGASSSEALGTRFLKTAVGWST
ncbi:hypothetical protein, partial [Streptomyces sp. NPDC058667]|uniref:hypothetical protein n=1 Tax=Streptomyces sp. NPDC058667 TaxID=3346588 RepID=UPI00365FB3D2